MEQSEFFDFLWADLKGWACVATIDASDKIEEHYYRWPVERDKALAETAKYNGQFKGVFASPALFKKNKRARENFEVARVEWADYDNGLKETIYPDLTIQTSAGKFHAYWILPQPIRNADELERRNKQHRYADTCWDAPRLLRVPGTVNGKNGWPVTRTELGPISYLPLDVQDLYWNGVPEGKRGKSLFRLAACLAEGGLERETTESLVRDADERWGKFSVRPDGDRRICDILDRVYSRAGRKGADDSVPLLGWADLQTAPGADVEWVYPGLLYRGALGAISGPPGVGKTQFCLRLAAAAGLGKDFLTWRIEQGVREKALFLSYELGPAELTTFVRAMADLAPEAGQLNEQVIFQAYGFSQYWADSAVQDSIEGAILENGITGVIVDALGSTTSRSLNDDSEVKSVLDFADRLRTTYGVWVLLIHHQRKEDSASKRKPKGLADLFGSQYIGGRIRTSLILWPGDEEGVIEISSPKITLAPPMQDFAVRRTATLDFEVINGYEPSKPRAKKDKVEQVQQFLFDVTDDDERDEDGEGLGI